MNTDINYYEGDKRAVILFHSYTSGTQDVASLARFLNREGFSVYTPTLRGHGNQVRYDKILKHHIEEWKQDVDDAVKFMIEKGFEKVSIFGLSLGGIMSVNQLINDDRVFAGGAFSASPELNSLEGVKNFFMNFYTPQMKSLGLPEKSKEEIGEQLESIFEGVQEMNQENLNKLETFDKPIFLAQGGLDDIINPMDTVRFRNKLYTNQIHFYWYADAPHVITVGKTLSKLRVNLLSFLNTLTWE